MHDTLRFWLDRGVDGFRVDVVHLLGKTADLADLPVDPNTGRLLAVHDYDDTHQILRDIRKVLDEYEGDRMMVGEVYILSTARVAKYYGIGDELHLSFNFPPLYAPWDAAAWRKRINRVIEELDPRDAWPTWVLSNHDNPRHRTRYGSDEKARAAAILLLTLRGTPFLYAGEELGLEDALIPADRVLDPGGRDGCRAPIPWTSAPDHGWGVADPWLPWPPDADERNADAAAADPDSMLNLYHRLLAARHASPALQTGSFSWLDVPDGVLAYERSAEHGDRRIAVINFTGESQSVLLDEDLTIEVASDGKGEGATYTGRLAPHQALLLVAT
jgi:alpha-glucosidase